MEVSGINPTTLGPHMHTHPPKLFLVIISWFCFPQANKKITDAKLAKDFQAVLKEFQKAQRLAAERETSYTPFISQAVLPSR